MDILDDKVINLLRDLETLKVIRLHPTEIDSKRESINSIKKLQGQMAKRPLEEIDEQIKTLLSEWD